MFLPSLHHFVQHEAQNKAFRSQLDLGTEDKVSPAVSSPGAVPVARLCLAAFGGAFFPVCLSRRPGEA